MKKSIKIIHCAHFNESKFGAAFYAMDRKISNGLIRNGHYVYDFSYRQIAKCSTKFGRKKGRVTKVNQALMEAINNIQPSLLLLGHSELIENKTLREIRLLCPTIKIAMWWVDWVYNLKKIEKRLDCLDHFFITTAPSVLSEVFSSDRLLSKCHYLPNICDHSIDTYRGFDADDYQYDLLFIARYDEQRQPLIDFIKEHLSDIRCGLFGQNKNNLLLGSDYLETIAASKIAINFNRNNDLSMYSSDRMIHLAANGTLVMSARIPQMNEVFNDEEVVYFNDFSELEEKVRYYLAHDKQRRHLAKASWRRAHEFYNEKRVTQRLLKRIFNE